MDSIPHPLRATVVDNADPEGLGRVRFRIPGLFDPSSPWALPMGGGSLDRGLFMVPPVGAEIVVLFIGGNPEDPMYTGGHWGVPDGTNEAPEEAGGSPSVTVLSTPGFRIELDDTDGGRKLRLIGVDTGDVIHLDSARREIMIKATTRVSVIADGAVDIDGIAITIGGRPVRQGIEDPI